MEYTITLSPNQIHAVKDAVELLMRLKINQPHEITRCIMDINACENKEDIKAWIDRRDQANKYLDQAFMYIYPDWEHVKKDDLWHCLYDIYQVMRYAIHEVENPNSTGVDSYPPFQSGKEPLPKIQK